MNVIGPDVDGTPASVNGFFVDGILMNVNNLDVDGNWIGWTSPHNDFSCYQTSLLGCLGPFSVTHPSLLTPNLSPVCVIAQVLHPSRQVTRALKLRISSDGFGTIPTQGRNALSLIRNPYLRTSYAFVLARWILEKIPQNRFQRNSPNVFQTFFLSMGLL